ncbi:DUF5686 and carboxypeptidase regulatory-like domain-containing protein [Pedobacter sp. AW31-3R]|uniref:DUF5686 and carboxypeptidase regulatory-like domain-containing protein n=1 Tax=Pedobacter sp. AW31-3R TaxID=3445781 RepID=UPI003F9FB36C
MKLHYLILSLFLLISGSTLGQTFSINGTIKDKQGLPLPFVSIYLKNTAKGTSANTEGQYTLRVDSGKLTLVFKAIGYKTLERSLTVRQHRTENITLEEEAYTLNGVTIAANGKDPAESIMKKAIRKRKTYLRENDAYTVKVYIKGMQKLVAAPKRFLGNDIEKVLELDTNRKGILYLSESQSIFHFKSPDKVREEMISSKISGRNNSFSFNKASDLNLNFYENILLENKLMARGVVSPVADHAMSYYQYKLLGFTEENGETIHKIEVIPRHDTDPVFSGVIYIAEDSWRLMGTALYLTKKSGINVLDTLEIRQQFIKVENSYLPSDINFRFRGNVLGFKFEGYYLGVFDNYNLHPKFPPRFFNGELLSISDTVNKKDSTYWAKNRPIPLSTEEKTDYRKKDSIAVRKTSSRYLDSVDRELNKISLGKVVMTGYTLRNTADKKFLNIDPLLKSILYNTVEGFAIKLGATYSKILEEGKYYTIRPEIRYGFSNETLTANLKANYYYDPQKLANVGISFGNGIVDLNNLGSMPLLSNSLNALLFERNFSKFYKKNFLQANTGRELANGLQAELILNYAKNEQLSNTTDFSFFDFKNRMFTSNNPFSPDAESQLFPDYRALTFSASLTYTMGQQYITRPNGKFYQESPSPTFKLNYRKGIKDLLNSDADYDLLSLEISKDKMSAGMLGYSKFAISAGKFLNNRAVYYPDLQHFSGNNSLTSAPELRKFSFLDFYQYSSSEQYLELHFEHNFAGLMSNKVPLLRKLKLEELLGINYLSQPLRKNYSEVYFGIQRLIFRATYGFAFNGNRNIEHGFRIYYGF